MFDDSFRCFICGGEIKRKDADSEDPKKKWVYHKSLGWAVHCYHHGVKEWYGKLMKKANDVFYEESQNA